MTDRERDDLLIRLDTSVEDIKGKLERDFAALHGNGHPGLLARMAAVETWIREHSESWKWIISTIIAVAAVAVAALKSR
ncbi:MAG: hypothetical protein J6Y54_03735 [Lentisphaeria bacterium]|nr:hypothetical protein [Lentisphaeria bacterium]